MKTWLLLTLVLFSHLGQAQEAEVWITSSGSHVSKDEAKKAALREALEMTLGTYISSTSSVQNNQLINDEITSITKGLIKAFKVVSELKVDEEWQVMTDVLVSLDHTVTYLKKASPKGTKVELNGSLFALNALQRSAEKQNESIIIAKTAGEMHNLFEKGFDYDLTTSEPTGQSTISIRCTTAVYANSNIEIAAQFLVEVLNNISIDINEIQSYIDQNLSFYPLTFQNDGMLHVYFLRSELSVDILRRLFNNFDYYTTRAYVSDGIGTYPLEVGKLPMISSLSGNGGQKTRKFYHQAQSTNFIQNYLSTYDREFNTLPNTVHESLKEALKPNEWHGSRKITSKEQEGILEVYNSSNIPFKNPDRIRALIKGLNQNPSVFDTMHSETSFLNKNKFVLESTKSSMLIGPKGERLSEQYLRKPYITDLVDHYFLPSSGELTFTTTSPLKYSLEQLRAVTAISIHPSQEFFACQQGAIQLPTPSSSPLSISLAMERKSYSDVKENQFQNKRWRMAEKKHYLALDELTSRFPYFNLFPAQMASTHTSELIQNEYRCYLSQTLETERFWDGTREPTGPYLHFCSNSAAMNEPYYFLWVRDTP